MSSRYVSPELRRPRNGRTIKQAARLTGLTEQTIKRWTSEPRETYLSRAQQRRERILELRATGMSMRAIATEVGCAVGTVHNALKETA
jgi:DNA-binding NarL/FixJ family response regulator